MNAFPPDFTFENIRKNLERKVEPVPTQDDLLNSLRQKLVDNVKNASRGCTQTHLQLYQLTEESVAKLINEIRERFPNIACQTKSDIISCYSPDQPITNFKDIVCVYIYL